MDFSVLVVQNNSVKLGQNALQLQILIPKLHALMVKTALQVHLSLLNAALAFILFLLPAPMFVPM